MSKTKPPPIKTTIFILFLLATQAAFAQTQKANRFYLYYGVAGLGSNLGNLEPTVIVHKNHFTYRKVQNSYWGKRPDLKSEFINKGYFRQSSIDSLLYLVKDLKDSTIFKTNPCFMSGSIIYISIANGGDTTLFRLGNTFDPIALKIINIINPYLPNNQQLYYHEDYIKEEQDCFDRLHERRSDSTIKQ